MPRKPTSIHLPSGAGSLMDTIEYHHATIRDVVANWAERGLDPEHLVMQAVRSDGAIAVVPYSEQFPQMVEDHEQHLRRMADEAFERLDR